MTVIRSSARASARVSSARSMPNSCRVHLRTSRTRPPSRSPPLSSPSAAPSRDLRLQRRQLPYRAPAPTPSSKSSAMRPLESLSAKSLVPHSSSLAPTRPRVPAPMTASIERRRARTPRGASALRAETIRRGSRGERRISHLLTRTSLIIRLRLTNLPTGCSALRSAEASRLARALRPACKLITFPLAQLRAANGVSV